MNPLRSINTITPFERTHFDRAASVVLPHSVDIQGVLGFDLTSNEILQLSGAPAGSTVVVSHRPAWHEPMEKPPIGIYFDVSNSTYIRTDNLVGVYVDDPILPSYGLYLKSIDFKPTGPRRLAARMLAVVVRQAMALGGISKIRLLAAGGRTWPDMSSSGERWGGFNAWPKYGFDMNLLPETLAICPEFSHYPPGLLGCRTAREVLQVVGGSEFWRLAGDGWYMEFDLSSTTTASIKMLDDVLRKDGI